jgi:hypothetical protein
VGVVVCVTSCCRV